MTFVIPRRREGRLHVDGFAKIADCGSCETELAHTGGSMERLGILGFGGLSGYIPCGIGLPVISTTWSSIKATYGQQEAPTVLRRRPR